MDQMVLETQQWLNATYTGDYGYNPVTENGQTGWETIYGLTRALQIELGISEPSDNFGPTTTALCPTLSINSPSDEITDSNIVRILQGALFCKGYNPTAITGNFGQYTQGAIMQLQSDAGLSNVDGVATPAIFKALLNMDAFVLVPNGDPTIRTIQQSLNHDYVDIIGIRPCDGLYGRSTNEALIYALQVEEGISEPNGNFGPTTTSLCPTLSLGSTDTNFVKILQYSLYCNGFDPGSFDGQYSDSVQSAVSSFQQFMALPVTGVADMSTIKALLSSAGDTNRDALACDCATILDANTAQAIKNAEFEYVGRYLTGTVTLGDGSIVSKAMTREELDAIFNAGLKVFPIYEDGGYELEYFTGLQGALDARAAIQAATNLGIPQGTTIYFAVDFDALDDDITNNILPYFQSIAPVFQSENFAGYKVGIYGARNICTRVCDEGFAEKSFVADMSTGFSGNLGFKMPQNWAFDQFNTITVGDSTLGFVEVDTDGYSGRDEGFDHVLDPSSLQPSDSDLYNARMAKVNEVKNDVSLLNNMPTASFTFDETEVIVTEGLVTVKVSASVKEKVKESGETSLSVKNGKIDGTYSAGLDTLSPSMTVSQKDSYLELANELSLSIDSGAILVQLSNTATDFTISLTANYDSIKVNDTYTTTCSIKIVVKIDYTDPSLPSDVRVPDTSPLFTNLLDAGLVIVGIVGLVAFLPEELTVGAVEGFVNIIEGFVGVFAN